MTENTQGTGVLHVIHVPGDSRLFVAELYKGESDETSFYRIVEGGRYMDVACTEADVHSDLTVRLQTCHRMADRQALYAECASTNRPLYSGVRLAGVPVPTVVELPYVAPHPQSPPARRFRERGVAFNAALRNGHLL